VRLFLADVVNLLYSSADTKSKRDLAVSFTVPKLLIFPCSFVECRMTGGAANVGEVEADTYYGAMFLGLGG